MVGFPGSIQIVKLVLRKPAASDLPPSPSLPALASSYGFSNGSLKVLSSALLAWAHLSARAHFLAWGLSHVSKMGFLSRSTPHNREVHRTKAWGGKSLTSLKHWILTNTETDSGVYGSLLFLEELVWIAAKDADVVIYPGLKSIERLERISLP